MDSGHREGCGQLAWRAGVEAWRVDVNSGRGDGVWNVVVASGVGEWV